MFKATVSSPSLAAFSRNINFECSGSVTANSGCCLLYFGDKFLCHHMVCGSVLILTFDSWASNLDGSRSARLSIIFSVIRIDPWEKRRKQLLFIAVLFLGAFVVLLLQLFWVCEPDPAWKRLENPQCPLNMQVAIFQLVSKSKLWTYLPFYSST